jgi:protein SCO1/2
MMDVRGRIFTLLLLAVALTLGACVPPTPEASVWHGNPYPERSPAPDFSLSTTRGGVFQLSQQRGVPVLLYFGYTHSPDIDPATLYNVSWVFDKLTTRPEYQVEFVMVSVDPARDTPSEFRRYLDAYDPSFIGLLGDPSAIQAVEAAYDVTAEKKAAPGPGSQEYTIEHTSTIFVIDRQGNLVTRYPYGTEPEDILSDLLYLFQGS